MNYDNKCPTERATPEATGDEPQNFAPSPDFKWFCEELFYKLDAINEQRQELGKAVTVKRVEAITHFIKLWRTTVGDDFYPILRLMFPYRDPRAYYIKDFTLIKAICKALSLPRDSLTERRLLNWKQFADRGTSLSKFCVQEIMQRRKEPLPEQPLTIDGLNEKLDELTKEVSGKKRRGVVGLSESPSFQFCLKSLSFLELRYFFDIILKNRVIGGLEHKFLACWHPDAQSYLGVVSDLKTLSKNLWKPSVRLGKKELSINLGYAFAPHLAKRLHVSYERVCSKLMHDFIIEEKMDGERIQLHYINGGSMLKFLSRRGTDFSHLYGQEITRGVISQHLRFKNDVRDCVLDGEMVSYDKERNVILPFGIVKSAAVDELINSEFGNESNGYRPLYMVFDLVYLNGISLTKIPLHIRKEYLKKILSPVPNVVEILNGTRACNAKAIKSFMHKAIKMGSEGVIIKQASSAYEVGARNDKWIKIKPEYFEDLGETLDLVVIGRDPGKKDSFMCGLVASDSGSISEFSSLEEHDLEVQPTAKCISFCNIANGVSDEEFKEINRKTRGLWVNYKEHPPPLGSLEFGSKVPVEWIDPKNSVVLEVKARSIENNEFSTKKYRAGSTLHGAYCRRIRDDKDWKTCTTVAQYQQAKAAHNYHLYRRRAHQVSPRRKRSMHDMLECHTDELGSRPDTQASNIFEGLQFYILSDYVTSQMKRFEKGMIAAIVAKHGGLVVKNIDVRSEHLSHLRIVSGKSTIECYTLANRGYDIIDPCWILDCISAGCQLGLEPKHCFQTSQKLLKNSHHRIDQYGDSFFCPLDAAKFHQLIKYFHPLSPGLSPGASTTLQDDLDDVPLFLLQKFWIYIVAAELVPQQFAVLKKKIEAYGGVVSETLEGSNLVLVPSALSMARIAYYVQELRQKFANNALAGNTNVKIPHIVRSEWLDMCTTEQCLVPEEDFPPV
ncbi:LAQU0S03e09472g1_1 [Lachancea quebecensis]|uniref:DNA ligase n=1 Tax=Lachancea quebecensis TaxID=1654605 RepID=A0A0P1KQ88_9SACH|nr:LAQU0S03e09472g1_1 [Lachancea quebecensis]